MTVPDIISAPQKTLERDIERYFIQKIKQLGGYSWKFSSPNNRGVCDRIVLIDGRVMFVELKRDGGRLTSLQARFKDTVQAHGGEYVCLVGYRDVERFTIELKNRAL